MKEAVNIIWFRRIESVPSEWSGSKETLGYSSWRWASVLSDPAQQFISLDGALWKSCNSAGLGWGLSNTPRVNIYIKEVVSGSQILCKAQAQCFASASYGFQSSSLPLFEYSPVLSDSFHSQSKQWMFLIH
jgi:hypothetical protein